MNRRRGIGSVLGMLLTLSLAAPALAAPAACEGVAIIDTMSNLEVRVADGTTFVEFDFTGSHTICLADGSTDIGSIAGHLAQATTSTGLVTIRFFETLTYGDGSLDFRGEAVGNGALWRSAVRSVGAGTGSLTGIHGQGQFWPTSPSSFGDSIAYVYPPN
jgi:hypothetical protein